MPKIRIAAIVAMDESRLIGVAGGLPWQISEDLRRFSQLTKGHTVLMGRKTYQSLPDKYRPLPGRLNLVVTGNRDWGVELRELPNVVVAYSISETISEVCSGKLEIFGDTLWIAGGAQVYLESLNSWDEVYLTRVPGWHEGDTYMPPFESDFELIEQQQAVGCIFERYRRNSKNREA